MTTITRHSTLVATRSAPTTMLVILAGLFLGACETTSHGQEGEIIGGVLGGVIGAQVGEGRGQTTAIILGTISGAMIGRHIGESMDETDRMKTAMVLNDSRTDQRTTWVNPDTGNQFTVVPTRTYEQSGSPCREFQLDATVGNQPNQEVYGTACLQADGSWLVQ